MPIVSIWETTKTFDVKEGSIIYDSLCDLGEELAHGCLSGSCGACRIEVISGENNLQSPGVIEQNTIDAVRSELLKSIPSIQNKVIRLSCRAKVIGDICISQIK